MNTNYLGSVKWSKSFQPSWDQFWKRKFIGVVIDRDIVEKLDRDGVDLILRTKKESLLVDEKVNTTKYGLDTFPIEILKNVELKKWGWAVTNNGRWIAMVHANENNFVDEPIFFELTDKFQQRISKSKVYKEFMTQTDGLYHTLFKVVPKTDLQNANNDAYWANDKPLWFY